MANKYLLTYFTLHVFQTWDFNPLATGHQGLFSMLGGGNIRGTLGGYLRALGDVQYIDGYHDSCEGYRERIGGCSAYPGDIMTT